MLGSTVPQLGVTKWILPLALVASLGTVVLWPGSEGRSATGETGVGQNAPDPLSILAGRSPGDREPGALFQTKALQNLMEAAGLPPAPQTNLIESAPLPGDEVPRAFSAIVPPNDVPVVPGSAPPVVPIGAIGNAAPPGGVTPFLPVLVPPIGVPVAFVPPTNTPPPEVIIPIGGAPAVPEPSTWLMMVAGFLSIGRTIRGARAAARSPAR